VVHYGSPSGYPGNYQIDLELTMNRGRVYTQIDRERDIQDVKWGGPAHDAIHETPTDWLDLIEGQLNNAWRGNDDDKIERLVKIAALAVAGLEVLQ
jgi:hypothetical protein